MVPSSRREKERELEGNKKNVIDFVSTSVGCMKQNRKEDGSHQMINVVYMCRKQCLLFCSLLTTFSFQMFWLIKWDNDQLFRLYSTVFHFSSIFEWWCCSIYSLLCCSFESTVMKYMWKPGGGDSSSSGRRGGEVRQFQRVSDAAWFLVKPNNRFPRESSQGLKTCGKMCETFFLTWMFSCCAEEVVDGWVFVWAG